jgi:hypothetical protein
VHGGGIASIVMPASQQLESLCPQLSTHGPPQVPFGMQQVEFLGSHTPKAQPPHWSGWPQLFVVITLQRLPHDVGVQHLFTPMFAMHVWPDGQLGVPPTPQDTGTVQLLFTVPHSFVPHAALLLSATHASPESSPGPTSGGASIPGASSTVLSIVETTSSPLLVSGVLPVSGGMLVSLPGATSAPDPSVPEPELTVESVDPSAGNGMPSSMPSRLPQPPAATAQARLITKASAVRAEAKRYPRFIS